ncbi:hypothetical protein [Desulfonema magnum]|uniref:STAS domain-containing protein n=1 Tax=Desulfonema magnum TaxID=45655 RepID=A0A975BTH3_9BACT|nr:hypothetical protein [Desulfonema magnum]QTA91143.1 STAS domain-containing protein [Desulfonema magnum]
MNLEGDGYTITYKDNIITIFGKLSLMLEDYEELEDFFEEVIRTEPSEITLDIRNLEYLNSSGIKTICVSLILEADDIEDIQMKILCSNQYTWQKETIPTFEDLMDDMEIVFE